MDNSKYFKAFQDARNAINKRLSTWNELTKNFNETYGTNFSPEALRKRVNRTFNKSNNYENIKINHPKNEYETKFDDGTIEAHKIVKYSKTIFGDKSKLLRYLGYNPSCWEFKYVKTSIWEQKCRDDEKTTPLYSVSFKLKPKTKNDLTYNDFVKESLECFSRIKPMKFQYNRINNRLDKTRLMLIPQIEAHLGKLSNEIETGVNYDHTIVEERVNEIFNEAKKLQDVNNCDKCLIVIGGDFFNSESNNQTTNGTPQTSTDTRFKKMFKIGLDLYTSGILSLREEFNSVDVILCAGNHSRAMEFFLYMALSCFFKDDKKVKFSTNYKDTQSYVFGKCGLFFNHGDPNQKRLVGSIPAEFYKEYGETLYRYLFLGHLHKLEVINCENGLTLHRVPAICENDGWHYQNRFGIGNIPQHEIIVFDKEKGMISNNFIYFD